MNLVITREIFLYFDACLYVRVRFLYIAKAFTIVQRQTLLKRLNQKSILVNLLGSLNFWKLELLKNKQRVVLYCESYSLASVEIGNGMFQCITVLGRLLYCLYTLLIQQAIYQQILNKMQMIPSCFLQFKISPFLLVA